MAQNESDEYVVQVSIGEQRLRLMKGDDVILDVAISTARNGPGEEHGSECTPRGWHKVRAKIGTDVAENTVFVARRPTGEVYSEGMRQQHPERDWILTRIMWLCGMEVGKNRLGPVDTMRRYIYIHGCPGEDEMGMPSSHGCIKMRNADVIALFDVIPVGTRVLIQE